jgi:hypothetical protein
MKSYLELLPSVALFLLCLGMLINASHQRKNARESTERFNRNWNEYCDHHDFAKNWPRLPVKGQPLDEPSISDK